MYKLLLLLFTVPLISYTINFDKSFEIELKPDTLTAHINIRSKKPDEKEVLNSLSKFSKFISEYEGVEKKGGNYSVSPEYRYENNHRFKSGYIGNMNYQISTKISENMTKFISELNAKKRSYSIDLSISSINWNLSKEQKDGKIDSLRLDAIKWIDTYAKQLSTDMNQSCKVTKVQLSQPNINYPRAPMMLEAKMMDSVRTNSPTPERSNQNISIKPHFELECK